MSSIWNPQDRFILSNMTSEKLYAKSPLTTGVSGTSAYIGLEPSATYNETVLWSGNAQTGTCSESPWNFEKLAFETSGSINSLQYNEMPAISGKNIMLMTTIGQESESIWHFTPTKITFNNNDFTLTSRDWYANTGNSTFTPNAGQHIRMIKIIGINRKEGN